MHKIEEYIYEPDRLIFYRDSLSEAEINEIYKAVDKSDKYDELSAYLKKLERKHMSATQKAIDLIGVNLTYNCHLRCNYCSYASTGDKADQLTSEDVLRFVGEAIKKCKIYNRYCEEKRSQPLRFFFTGGGEPTFNWKLFEDTVIGIKHMCEKYGIPCRLELTTNGMLNRKKRDFIKKNFDKIMVSYDGLPYLQGKNRKCADGKANYEMVEESLEDFCKSKLNVTVRSTVWNEDFCLLKDACDYLMENFPEIDEWSIMHIIPSGRALGNIKDDQYDADAYDFLACFLGLVNYVKAKKRSLYISTPLFINTIAEYCCGASFCDCYWLMPDRTITNCIEAEQQFRTIVGNIDETGVHLFSDYEDNHLDIVRDTFEQCRECLAYRFCKGGCPLKVMRDQSYGTEYRNYECELARRYWKYVFKTVLSGKECFGWYVSPVAVNGLSENDVFMLCRMEE